MTHRIERQYVATVAEAMRRVQPRHRQYVLRRAEGISPGDAWRETMTQVKEPEASGRSLETKSPSISRAIEVTTTVVLKGSLMSIGQRRDFVLDRLVREAEESSDTGRIRALELIGKTASLFMDRSEVTVTSTDDVKARIEQMIQSIKEREIVIEAIDAEGLNEEGTVIPEDGDDPLAPYQPRADSA